jgi:hypothetical protein
VSDPPLLPLGQLPKDDPLDDVCPPSYLFPLLLPFFSDLRARSYFSSSSRFLVVECRRRRFSLRGRRILGASMSLEEREEEEKEEERRERGMLRLKAKGS